MSGAFLVSGCGSSEPRPEGDEGRRAEPTARDLADDMARLAAKDLAGLLSSRTAQGWPAHTVLVDGKPLVRLGRLTNRSRTQFDSRVLLQTLQDELRNQGAVAIATEPEVMAENEDRNYDRDYGRDYADDEDDAVPGEKAAPAAAPTLLIRGEISQDERSTAETEQTTTYLRLELIDTVSGMTIDSVVSKIRQQRG